MDLGDQIPIGELKRRILGSEKPAVIIEAHGLGNADNVVKILSAEAVKKGKLVIVISRILSGEITTEDIQSLIAVNEEVLAGSNHRLIRGHKLNKTAAKAVLVRALLEGLDQNETQGLVDLYCYAKGMLSKDYEPQFKYMPPQIV